MAAQRPLEPLILVRVQAPQLLCLGVMKSEIEEDPPEYFNEIIIFKRAWAVFTRPLAYLLSLKLEFGNLYDKKMIKGIVYDN